jgi:hypothetical protein
MTSLKESNLSDQSHPQTYLMVTNKGDTRDCISFEEISHSNLYKFILEELARDDCSENLQNVDINALSFEELMELFLIQQNGIREGARENEYYSTVLTFIKGNNMSAVTSYGDECEDYYADVARKYPMYEDVEEYLDIEMPEHSLEGALVNQRLITDVFKKK